ncbi:hypothetical protein F3Y22_tig00110946pilonHSYRG00005 [Hibiscus syriacus]|uniref:RNase H type-1 domain-containing protein n=1 Tax=Hibiscus syriacus TaxID=106335 RepID=A0A6A2ZD86_HIBSY|nr:hypothetical protein F3Y22_tig00110946pilonHSYRG00005 [Hibiscus syriacus]
MLHEFESHSRLQYINRKLMHIYIDGSPSCGARNSHGSWKFGFNKFIGVYSVVNAKLCGAYIGRLLAWEAGFRHVVLEIESSEAVRILRTITTNLILCTRICLNFDSLTSWLRFNMSSMMVTRGQRKIIPLGQWFPKVAVDVYVAPNVVLAGQVTVNDGASVWNGCVLRGDLNKITVGFCSNVQERSVIHAAWSSPTAER